MADSGAGIAIVRMPAELDLASSEGVAEQGCAAIARLARLVLLDLIGLSFCDARGLRAFVRIANQADAAGCGFGLIGPRPPAAKILRISGWKAGCRSSPPSTTPGRSSPLQPASRQSGTHRSTARRSAGTSGRRT